MSDQIVVKVVTDPPLGLHTRQRIFVGPDSGHLQLAGQLMLRESELAAWNTMLRVGAAATANRRDVTTVAIVFETRPLGGVS